MPIKIPSKNIYDKTHNIINKNNISKIQAVTKTNSNSQELGSDKTTFINENIITNTYPSKIIKSGVYTQDDDYTNSNPTWRYGTVQLHIEEYYTFGEIKVPKHKDPLHINESVFEPDDKNARKIDLRIEYEKREGIRYIRPTNLVSVNSAAGTAQIEYGSIFYGEETDKITKVTSTQEIVPEHEISLSAEMPYQGNKINVTLVTENTTRLNGADFKETDTEYIVSFSIFSGYKLTDFEAMDFRIGDKLSGNYIEYIPKKISLTPQTKVVGVDFNEANFSISLPEFNEESTFSFQSNELMQTRNIRKVGENTESAVAALANDILAEYSNGKEIATLNCSYDEYYNADGTKAISVYEDGLPIGFKIGDIVTPYIKKPSISEDIPLSVKADGTPKDFVVAKIKNVDDGVSMQEITVIEN